MPTNEVAFALLLHLKYQRQACMNIFICALAGFFMMIQAAVMVLEVVADYEKNRDNVVGINPLPRRRYYPRGRVKRVRTEPTATCIDTWDDARFKHELHVSKTIFYDVVEACKADLEPHGNRGLKIQEQVYVAFCWLSGGGSFAALSRQAQRGRTTVHRCVTEVTSAITKNMGDRVPGPPRDQACMAEVVAVFEQMGRSANTPGIPNIFACMDGSHIPIKRFAGAGEKYYNYKGWNSVLMHAFVDNRMKIIDVLVGYSGRNNDSTQLRATQLFNDLQEGMDLRQNLVDMGMPIGGVKAPLLILGDNGYEPHPFIVPPFKEPEMKGNNLRSKFNVKHAKTRVIAEHTFGVLKNRFRVLLKEMEVSEENAHNVILACVILHNMCIDGGVAEPMRDEHYESLVQQYAVWDKGRLEVLVPLANVNAPTGCNLHTSDVVDGTAIREAIVQWVNTPL